MANAPRLEVINGAKADQLKAALADLAQALKAVSRQADQAGAQTSGAFAGMNARLRWHRGQIKETQQLVTVHLEEIVHAWHTHFPG